MVQHRQLEPSLAQLFINGKSCDGAGGTFPLVNPATEETIADIAIATKQDVDKAVDAAEKAQPAWAALAGGARAAVLQRWAQLIAENSDELVRLDALAMGRPVASNTDAHTAAYFCRYFASLAENVAGRTSTLTPGHLNFTLKEGYGVVAGIIPWNVPLVMFTWKAGPAIAAGNAIIIKSSEKAPLSSILLAKLLQQAGCPDGIVQVLSGAGETGSALASHMRVRKIAFTGSARAGRLVQEAAAKSNLKAVTLELGGKSPTIICEDADVEQAVAACTASLYNSGQICIATTRLYVHDAVYDAFVKGFSAAFSKLEHGDPLDHGTVMGPVADKLQAASVQKYLDFGRTEGKALIGGARADRKGYFFQPTLFTDVEEEIFGPVAVIHRYTKQDDAIRRANDTEYGLYASVFSKNIDRAISVARQLQAGNVAINATSPTAAADMPFGGYKQSGIGREIGPECLENWLETKSIYVRLS